jgi:hypothetical protein
MKQQSEGKFMQDSSDLTMIAVIAVAFVIGYLVVSFIFYVLKRGRENEAEGRRMRESRRKYGVFEEDNSQWNPGMGTRAEARADEDYRDRQAYESNDRHAGDEAYFLKVLSLPRVFTKEELETSHRRLAAQYHPDKVNHLGPRLKETAAQEMKKINEAYAFLKSRYNL